MCGLGGVARFGGAALTDQDERTLARMLATLEHRGPDDAVVETQGPVGFAFTRLSLVGVESGRQPFTNADSSVALMANGEVYNHRELAATLPGFRPRTQSDCEVLLPLYEAHGARFLDEVRGIIAVAVHDARRQELVLAVDPFANKPLFWATVPGAVVFASEIKALLDHPDVPRAVDWSRALADQGLANRSTFSHDPVNTWFDGVRKVTAGTVVAFDLRTGRERTEEYWTPTFADPARDVGTDDVRLQEVAEYVATYRELLFRSVEDSLMSEVGLGLFLSGGIDSAAIAAVASELGQPLTTFTVATEATMLNGDVAASVQVARHLGVEHTVAALGASDVPSPEDWNRLLWLMESPLAGPEQLYKFSLHRVAKQVHPGLKAMLLGAGADEFNGGYSHLLSGGGGWASFVANLAPMRTNTLGAADRHWLSGGQRGLVRVSDEKAAGDDYAAYVRWKYRDIQQYNCWMEDRCAAGNAIEARVPFLDRRLVDLSTRLPARLRPVLLWDKSMARHALRGLLPEHLLFREKKPFFDGHTSRFAHRTVLEMLRQQDCALVEQALSAPGAADHLDVDAVRTAVRTPASDVHPELLLRLVNLGLLSAAVDGPPAAFHADDVVLRAVRTPAADLAATFPALSLSDTAVLGLADDTVLARDASHASSWLLIDGHRVVFTIDEDDVGEWLALLRRLDGRVSLDEASGEAGVRWEDHTEYLELCLERGYLVSRGEA